MKEKNNLLQNHELQTSYYELQMKFKGIFGQRKH